MEEETTDKQNQNFEGNNSIFKFIVEIPEPQGNAVQLKYAIPVPRENDVVMVLDLHHHQAESIFDEHQKEAHNQ